MPHPASRAAPPCRFHVPSVYTGSTVAGAFGTSALVLEPVYWFVDLLAPFHVTNVVFTAGGDMRNASIYVGSNPASVFANTRVAVRIAGNQGHLGSHGGGAAVKSARGVPRVCHAAKVPSPAAAAMSARANFASSALTPSGIRLSRCRLQQGLNLAAGQQLAVAAGATQGRYVILYGGTASEGNINLDDCQVYTYGEPGWDPGRAGMCTGCGEVRCHGVGLAEVASMCTIHVLMACMLPSCRLCMPLQTPPLLLPALQRRTQQPLSR